MRHVSINLPRPIIACPLGICEKSLWGLDGFELVAAFGKSTVWGAFILRMPPMRLCVKGKSIL
jgi:hypothetical protein